MCQATEEAELPDSSAELHCTEMCAAYPSAMPKNEIKQLQQAPTTPNKLSTILPVCSPATSNGARPSDGCEYACVHYYSR
jgi:hypothetical protein